MSDDDTSDTASDTADLSVDDDEQATVDDSESDDGDDSGGDGEGSSDGDDGGDDVVAVATDLQGRISAIVASVSILFVIYLLISAFSARGMSKRYAKTYGLQRMTMKQNVTWGLEVFANLMSAGLLGLAFDVLNPNSGQCAGAMMLAAAGGDEGMGNPGMGNPGMGNPGMGNPGMGSPGMGSPDMASPDMASPGMGSPDMGMMEGSPGMSP